jgi:Lon protease-like protein
MLEIRDCVQIGDGCSVLSTVGTKRFRVLCRSEKDGYDTSVVEYIKDEPICKENYSSVLDLHNRVMSKARHWFKNLPELIKIEILRSFGVMPKMEKDLGSSQDGPSWTCKSLKLRS